jgi:hypothetical protein
MQVHEGCWARAAKWLDRTAGLAKFKVLLVVLLVLDAAQRQIAIAIAAPMAT